MGTNMMIGASVGSTSIGALLNQNEAPTDIALSASTIAENSAINTVIGTLSATDAVGDTFTFTLVSGTGSTDNASFNISGTSLRSSAAFDYETKSSYSIRIRVTDQDGLYFEKAFTITVIDVYEFDEIAPTNLTAVADSDTVINLAWTVNSANRVGHRIYNSTDNITFTEIGTVLGATAAYDATGLTADTLYYFKVVSYGGITESSAATANAITYFAFIITKTGTGLAVARLQLTINSNHTIKLTGDGRFYSDAGGTADESTTYDLTTGATRSRYLRLSTGTCKLLVKIRNVTKFGDSAGGGSGSGWTAGTNAPSLSGDVSHFVPANLTELYCENANNTLSGSINALTNLTYVRLGGLGSFVPTISFNLSNFTNATFRSANTACNSTYSTHTWKANTVYFLLVPSSAWSIATLSLAIIEGSATTWASGRTFYVTGTNMADTNQGGIWGDFSGAPAPSALATAYKALVKTKTVGTTITGIAAPGGSGDGTGFPAGFGNWYRT